MKNIIEFAQALGFEAFEVFATLDTASASKGLGIIIAALTAITIVYL